MAEVTITLGDTPTGGVSIRSSFAPAIGGKCTPAQAHALDLLRIGLKTWPAGASIEQIAQHKCNGAAAA